MLPLWTREDPRSNGNEGVHCIPQSSSIIRASPSDCLLPYPGHSLRSEVGVLPICRDAVIYSTAPTNWAWQLRVHHTLQEASLSNAFYHYTQVIQFKMNLTSLQKYSQHILSPFRKVVRSRVKTRVLSLCPIKVVEANTWKK